MKEFMRLAICLVGLSMMSTLFWDILKEWQFVSISLSPAWGIIPVLIVYIINELTYSSFIKDNPNLSPKIFYTLDRIFENLLLILGILLIISVPFVWFGAIETTIRNAR
jgi:hypothetical protein